jgi:hypothetical protein
MDVYQRRRLVALSILAGAFVIIVLLVRSCGGDEEEPAPLSGATGIEGVAALSQEDYVAQADAVCLDANTTLASVDDSDPVAAATEEGQILAGQLQSLETLAAPTDGADDLESYLTALGKQVDAYNGLIEALDRGDDEAAAELQATIDKQAGRAQNAAENFGFEVCGDPSQVGEASGDGDTADATDADTEAAVPAAPVEPAPTTTVPTTPTEPVTPPADEGGVTPATPPADDGSGSGGVTP